jgi:hypothetical protein
MAGTRYPTATYVDNSPSAKGIYPVRDQFIQVPTIFKIRWALNIRVAT